MRNTFLGIALAILAFMGIAQTANAATGNRFLPEALTRQQMIPLIHQALTRDPTGHAKLMPAECAHDANACATPYDYLVSFQEYDSEAGLKSISQLEEYFASLQDTMTPEGTYQVSCLVPQGNGNFRPLANCEQREFYKGEKVSYNPRTHKIVLAWHCKNPVGGRFDITVIANPCVELHFFLKKGDTVHIATIAPYVLHQSVCKMALKKTGMASLSTDLRNECPTDKCTFDADASELSASMGAIMEVQGRKISFRAAQAGENVLQVPSYFATRDSMYVTVLCVTTAEGRKSCGQDMHWMSYVHRDAYVVYDKSQAPADWHGLAHVWKFSDEGCDYQ